MAAVDASEHLPGMGLSQYVADSAQACFSLLPGLGPEGSSGPGSARTGCLVQPRQAALPLGVPPGCARGLLPPPACKHSSREKL